MVEMLSFAPDVMLAFLRMNGLERSWGQLLEDIEFIETENSALTIEFQRRGMAVSDYLSDRMKIFVEQALGRRPIPGWKELHSRGSALESLAGTIQAAYDELGNTLGALEGLGLSRVFLPRAAATTLSDDSDSPRLQPIAPTEEVRAYLLRIASSHLGRLPFRTTLRDTFRVANSPAAADLRLLLDAWSRELVEGRLETLQTIEKDANKAMAALRAADGASEGSRLITYLGLAATAASLFSEIPVELGIATTILGSGFQGISDAVKSKYRWASFGNN
jgi:hypothetical protein